MSRPPVTGRQSWKMHDRVGERDGSRVFLGGRSEIGDDGRALLRLTLTSTRTGNRRAEGGRARIDRGYRSGVAARAALARVARPAAPAEARPREQRNGRPREHRGSRSRVTRAGPKGDDDPGPDLDPLPWPRRSDVDRVFLDALARFETLREFDELAVRCLRKASFLFAIGWPR